MSAMTSYFKLDNDFLYLPYSTSFEITNGYNDEEFENVLGTVYLIPGKATLREFELSGYITKNKNNFFNRNSKTELNDYISFFERARKLNKPLRVVVANEDVTVIDMDCLASLTYSNLDGAGDISFKITVKEYKKINGG